MAKYCFVSLSHNRHHMRFSQTKTGECFLSVIISHCDLSMWWDSFDKQRAMHFRSPCTQVEQRMYKTCVTKGMKHRIFCAEKQLLSLRDEKQQTCCLRKSATHFLCLFLPKFRDIQLAFTVFSYRCNFRTDSGLEPGSLVAQLALQCNVLGHYACHTRNNHTDRKCKESMR